jgi:hypothetical protein
MDFLCLRSIWTVNNFYYEPHMRQRLTAHRSHSRRAVLDLRIDTFAHDLLYTVLQIHGIRTLLSTTNGAKDQQMSFTLRYYCR